ncbi:MAG TPA: phospholipase D-like domain-containing protein [Bacteroidia bacterium]|jgi:HKD family nuclease|nr:phospholipase D-like domain-containing protein [Bacteroidia bacterium]
MIQYKLKLASEFEKLLKDCEEIWFAVAMISDSGFKYIQNHINQTARQNYIVGVGLPTSPRVLKKLKDVQDKGFIKSRIYKKTGELFHPKAYILKTNKELTVFIGSGNCTIGGFKNNYEISIMTNDTIVCNNLLLWFKELFSNCDEITDDFLDSYKQLFQKRIKWIEQDKKEVQSILSEPDYYILNTNIKEGKPDEIEMLSRKKAAAYFDPWKNRINSLKKGDRVFLYSSGKGIIAMGEASGVTLQKEYQNKIQFKDEEHYQKLTSFKILSKPLSASQIKKLSNKGYIFRQVLFRIAKKDGEKIWARK